MIDKLFTNFQTPFLQTNKTVEVPVIENCRMPIGKC